MFKFTLAFNAVEISLIMKIARQNRLSPPFPDIIIASEEEERRASDLSSRNFLLRVYPSILRLVPNNFRAKKRVKKFHKDSILTSDKLPRFRVQHPSPIYVGEGWTTRGSSIHGPPSPQNLDIYCATTSIPRVKVKVNFSSTRVFPRDDNPRCILVQLSLYISNNH